MSTIDLTSLCERMQKQGYVWASLQPSVERDLWEKIHQGADPDLRGVPTMKPEAVFFSRLELDRVDEKLEPAWKSYVESVSDAKNRRWFDHLGESWLVFAKPKATARFITEDTGLMDYRMKANTYVGKRNFRFNDIPATRWDGVEVNMETTQYDSFEYWNVTTLAVWNKACLETCIVFKPVPNQQFTYYDGAIDLDVRGDGLKHIEAQPGLTAEARAELVALNTQTDKIVDYLETVTRRWDNAYLDRLRSFDNDHAEAMAKFIKKHWKGASHQITALFKLIHEKRNEVRGTPALGLYTFYEHVWMQVRGANGFDSQELRKPALELVSQVFVDSYQNAIPMGGLESRWVSETLEDFCHTQLDKMTETKKINVQQEMKQEADYYRQAGKGEYSVMVALLDRLSVYKTQRGIGEMSSARDRVVTVHRLEGMAGIVCALRGRVVRLESLLLLAGKYATVEEIDARLAILRGLRRTMHSTEYVKKGVCQKDACMHSTDRSQIDRCEREIAELLEERAELVQGASRPRRRENPDRFTSSEEPAEEGEDVPEKFRDRWYKEYVRKFGARDSGS